MNINTQATIPVTELGNFSKLANTINSITVDDTSEYISDEEFYAYADKLLKKDAEVYKQLAK